jgi:hypothetical protein
MITLHIDNPELERVYYEEFGGDEERFVAFISQSCSANNTHFAIDAATMERLYDEGEASGDSGLTHEEVFEQLRAKYAID